MEKTRKAKMSTPPVQLRDKRIFELKKSSRKMFNTVKVLAHQQRLKKNALKNNDSIRIQLTISAYRKQFLSISIGK